MSQLEAGKAAQSRLPEDLFDELIAGGYPVSVKKGKIIVGHFDDASEVFVVEEGFAQVSLLSKDGKEAIFREIGAREIFGELAALDGAPRSASVIATTDMRLHKVSSKQFEDWLSANSEAGLWLARLLVARIRDMTERSFELATMTVIQRIHLEILRLADREEDSHTRVTVNNFPTHTEFAARIGTHREAISRELSWLRGKGMIETNGRRLTVLDVGELRRLTQQ